MKQESNIIRSAQGTLVFILFLCAIVPVALRDLSHQLISSVHLNPIFEGYRKPTLALGCFLAVAFLGLVWREAHRTLRALYPVLRDGKDANPAYQVQHKEFFYWSGIAILSYQGYGFIWLLMSWKSGNIVSALASILPSFLGCVAGLALFLIPSRQHLKQVPKETDCPEKPLARWTIFTFFGYNMAFLVIDILGQWGLLKSVGATSIGLSNKVALLGALWLLPLLTWALPLGRLNWVKASLFVYLGASLLYGSILAPGLLLAGLYFCWINIAKEEQEFCSLPVLATLILTADLVGHTVGYFLIGYEGGPLVGFVAIFSALMVLENSLTGQPRLPFTTWAEEVEQSDSDTQAAPTEPDVAEVLEEGSEQVAESEPTETVVTESPVSDEPSETSTEGGKYWDI